MNNKMNHSFALILLLSFLATTLCASLKEVGIPGTLIQEQLSSINYSLQIPNCGKNIGPICSDDCRILMACIGDPEPIHVENCEESNRETPYCVDKVCTRHPDHHNSQCRVNRLRCTSEGVFPDPYDCTTYYSCFDGLNTEPRKFKCPQDYVYSSEMKLCRRKTSNSLCETVNCSNYHNKFMAFSHNRAYYAFCGVPIQMFKCADERNYVFDTSVNDCVYHCKRSGYFIDPENCSQYFICEKTGEHGILQRCPYDYKFNGSHCVESKDCINVPDPAWPPPDIENPIPTNDPIEENKQ